MHGKIVVANMKVSMNQSDVNAMRTAKSTRQDLDIQQFIAYKSMNQLVELKTKMLTPIISKFV